MKKGIIVLLITVLAAGMAFASLTGSASIDLGYDFNDKTYGFKNEAKGTYKFTFTFDTISVTKGEDHQTDVWAEIAATASATWAVEEKEKNSGDTSEYSTADNSFVSKVTFKISTANIHIKGVTIGILNAGGAYNYAADYHTDDYGVPVLNKVFTTGNNTNGFNVTYDGFSGGFGFFGDADDETYNVLAHVQTKSFEFVEGLTAQAVAYAYFANDAKQFYFATNTAYSAEKISADIAGELAIIDSKVNFEAAANASYDFVYANFYFYTLASDRDAEKKAYLDAKLGAGYTFGEDFTVEVNGYADAVNVIADEREITLGVDATATISPWTIYGEASYYIYAKELKLVGMVTYTHDIVVASAKLSATLKFGADQVLTSLEPVVSISADKTIVENATLALSWSGADLAKSGDSVVKKGAVTASATISF